MSSPADFQLQSIAKIKAKLQNTRPLISISLNIRIATIVTYLVLESTPAHVNKVAGYSEVAEGQREIGPDRGTAGNSMPYVLRQLNVYVNEQIVMFRSFRFTKRSAIQINTSVSVLSSPR